MNNLNTIEQRINAADPDRFRAARLAGKKERERLFWLYAFHLELAKVPENTPFGIMKSSGKPMPAQVAEQVDPAATLRYYSNALEKLSGTNLMLMPFELK